MISVFGRPALLLLFLDQHYFSDQQQHYRPRPELKAPHTLPPRLDRYPYVTGTSVLGMTFKDGVIIACDTLGAYGSTKRYKSFQRLHKVNDACVLAAGGELSDFQYVAKLLQELADDDFCMDDGHRLKPAEVYSYLTRVMYNRRNK
jgi:20S proteasome subunit beta 7